MNHRSKMSRPSGALPALWLLLAVVACEPSGTGREDDAGGANNIGGTQTEFADEDARADPPSGTDAGAFVEDADTRGPRLNSIIPNSGPMAGGTRVRLVGTGFLEGTRVLVGERECAEIAVANENHLDCTTPPGFTAGPSSVTVIWSSGGGPHRVEDAFTYFIPLSVTGLAPDRGPARGGNVVTLEGTGFSESTEVRFAGTLSRTTLVDETHISAVVPTGEPGPVEVLVRSAFGEVRLPAGYTYFEELVVLGLEPRWGSILGGTEVGLRGAGLSATGTVKFGDADAEILRSELDRTRLVVKTPAASEGLVSVSVDNVNGAWRGIDAFLYLDESKTEFGVVGVVPSRVSTQGGDVFEVGGAGFDAETLVLIEGEAVECALTNPHILACEAPAHAVGAVDVVVRAGEAPDAEELVLAGALTFFERVDLYTLRPNRGAVSGGTLVEVRGEGFTEEMNLTLDGEPFTVVEFVDAGLVWAMTPPGRAGLVSAGAATSDDTALISEAFEYFNPMSRFGGVWGEEINGAINATVLDAYSGEPIPMATVISLPSDALPDDATNLLVGTTDDLGQVVLSARVVAAPQNVTGCAPDYECTTIERQTVENVTLYLIPQNPPSGGGGGMNEPIPNARLTGTVHGISVLEKPRDPYILLAFVDTTHSSPFNRRVNPIPEPIGVLAEDGPFDISVKPGEMAVVATAGYVLSADYDAYKEGTLRYWDLHETLIPIAMGFQRFISLSPGSALEGIELFIDKPMDLDVPASQANPPAGVDDHPYVYEAWPFLDFGAEGYWELDSKGFGDLPEMTLSHLPDIRAWDLDIEYEWIFWGHAGARLEIRLPYTVTTERTRDVTAGIAATPVSSLAVIDSPLSDEHLGPGRTIAWHWADGITGEPTTPPDATILTISSVEGLPLWTYVAPSDVTSVVLPRLPDGVEPGGLVDEAMSLTIVPFIGENGWNYGDFTYEDLGYWARHSYSASGVTFTR